ncbi:MAG: NUDIX domain-containing protein [Chloroflexi bacterium]|nr:NUDIX domain-containing protein [Chloroflexota bacterium]
MDDLKQALYLIVDEMRGMAMVQKLFSQNIYEQERADHMVSLAAKLAALAENASPADLQETFSQEPWNRASPIVGVDAAVFNHAREILLIQRRDNEHWAMPGGHSEIGHTIAETALRELWEEAGLQGRVVRLLGVFDGRLLGTQSRFHLIHPVFLVECDSLTPAPGTEAIDARFFARDHLPTPLHHGHEGRIHACFEALDGETFFDPVDVSTFELPMHQRPALPAADSPGPD